MQTIQDAPGQSRNCAKSPSKENETTCISPPTPDPVATLLPKQIRTLNDLQTIYQTAKFIALDCEFVSDIDWEDPEHSADAIYASQAPTEVGLAFLNGHMSVPVVDGPEASIGIAGDGDELRLCSFLDTFNVQAHSLKINDRYQARVEYLAQNPRQGKAARNKKREDFWFGDDEYVDVGDIEARLSNIIRSHQGPDTEDLILVGYDINADLQAMRRDFPAISSHFTNWLDIRTIIKSIFGPATSEVSPPGVRSLLKLFGYHHKDYDPNGTQGTYHNAGNDAVKTLALLHGLMVDGNIDNLRLRQRVPKDVELFEGLRYPRGKPGVVLLRPTDGSSLPEELGTVLRLASFAAPYDPQAVGIREQIYSAGQTQKKIMVTRGWVMFKSENTMHAFIDAANNTNWGDKTLMAEKPQGAPSFPPKSQEL